MKNIDKIIQIIIDTEDNLTGLSEAGIIYNFIDHTYKREDGGKWAKDEKGDLVIDKIAYWAKVIDSPTK